MAYELWKTPLFKRVLKIKEHIGIEEPLVLIIEGEDPNVLLELRPKLDEISTDYELYHLFPQDYEGYNKITSDIYYRLIKKYKIEPK